jgi:hypothetical protein
MIETDAHDMARLHLLDKLQGGQPDLTAAERLGNADAHDGHGGCAAEVISDLPQTHCGVTLCYAN